jgi:hypothetical protein
MTTTYHIKSLTVNTANSILTSSTGTKIETPTFFYKDNLRLNWQINDGNKLPVDMTGFTFTLKLAGDYNGTPLLTVNDGDFTDISISTGNFYCIADLNQAAILAYLTDDSSQTAYCSLWATKSGIDYLLANFTLTLKNIIF